MPLRGKDAFADLLSIEIDFAISEHAARPPTGPGSLVDQVLVDDLAIAYRDYLDAHLPALDTMWAAWTASADAGPLARDGELLPAFEPDTLPEDLARAGRDAALGEAMARALALGGQHPDPGVAPVLRRIRGTVDQLGATKGAERMRIARKAWELGTDRIVAQTVVQVDGDVVQRVDPSIFDAPAIRDLHRGAVAGAIGQWQELFGLFVTLAVGAAGLVRSLLGGGPALRSWQARRRQMAKRSERRARELWRPKVLLSTCHEFFDGMKGLFADGGTTITTPSHPDAQPYARTIIQPDGDSIWLIAPAAVGRREDLDAHAAAVTQWYANHNRVAATMERYASALPLVASTILTGLGVLVTGSWRPIALGLVASIPAPWAFRVVVGRCIRWRTRAAFR